MVNKCKLTSTSGKKRGSRNKPMEASILAESYGIRWHDHDANEIMMAELDVCITRPSHPKYALAKQRLPTFQTWPKQISQTPGDLTNAGLFYTGYGDIVRCFFCDGELSMWRYGVDPWSEHEQRFPDCPFVKHHKEELRQIQSDEIQSTDTDEVLQQLNEELMNRRGFLFCKICCDAQFCRSVIKGTAPLKFDDEDVNGLLDKS